MTENHYTEKELQSMADQLLKEAEEKKHDI